MAEGPRSKNPRVASRQRGDADADPGSARGKAAALESEESPPRRALDLLIRPTRAEIDLAALGRNIAAIRQLAPRAEILAIV